MQPRKCARRFPPGSDLGWKGPEFAGKTLSHAGRFYALMSKPRPVSSRKCRLIGKTLLTVPQWKLYQLPAARKPKQLEVNSVGDSCRF